MMYDDNDGWRRWNIYIRLGYAPRFGVSRRNGVEGGLFGSSIGITL
jgi:hypothetical protein